MPEESKRKRVRKRKLSKKNAQTYLWEDSDRLVDTIVAGSNGKIKRAELIRDLVDEALRARNLKAAGHDETLFAVRKAQTGVVSEGIAPLVGILTEQRGYVERSMAQMQQEYVFIAERLQRIENALGVVMKGFDRIVQNIILIRALIQFYIFEFYFTVLHSTGRKVSPQDLKRNYLERVKDIKIEAARERETFGEVALERTVAVVAERMVAEAKNPPSLPATSPATQTPQTSG